jgi:hypothetical protein
VTHTISRRRFIHDSPYNHRWLEGKLSGVAQGCPTSPLLSEVALYHSLIKYLIEKGYGINMYADDGYVYYNGSKPIEDDLEAFSKSNEFGIRIN